MGIFLFGTLLVCVVLDFFLWAGVARIEEVGRSIERRILETSDHAVRVAFIMNAIYWLYQLVTTVI